MDFQHLKKCTKIFLSTHNEPPAKILQFTESLLNEANELFLSP